MCSRKTRFAKTGWRVERYVTGADGAACVGVVQRTETKSAILL